MEKEAKLYGIRAIIEAIKSEKSIDKVFLQKGLSGNLFKSLESLIREKKLNHSYVPIEKLNRFTKKNHQGAVAEIAPIKFYDLDYLLSIKKKNPLYLILDQINDVRNFGAIARTAECCGVDGIVIQNKGSARVNGDSIKTSAGAIFNLPICKVSNIKDAIYYFQGSDIKVIAATEKTDKTIYKTDFSKGCAILMGSEEKGISSSILNLVDEKAKIPMAGKIESLNVSVACGAFLSEVMRQRNK
ncbi:MAG: 23S rRNA (guanosine(2251)-2'-O)-methyltransferase RlmB [Flavobacteriaceae bacterium]|nr:23S rRNA (guanosine(2251)-2'-O)-methyltransferase RlmB [Flavobacteriaceae bacterium]